VNEELVRELTAARVEFLAVLESLGAGRLKATRLLGEWSARELVAHLGYWAGHAAEVIHAVKEGRGSEVGVGEPTADEVNATVARVARQADLSTVRKREAASVQALVDRLMALDPSLLSKSLPDGATLGEVIREDGADHYREHAEQLRAAAGPS